MSQQTSGKNKRKRNGKSNELLKVIDDSSERLSSKSLSSNPASTNNLRQDYSNISVLILLYLLQGIPLGLIAAIPYLLTNRGVSYAQQAIFSFAIWPFSLKLVWAPIVDTVYLKRFGKRKSWLIPVQYMIGVTMVVISYHLESLIDSSLGLNIYFLTIVFLFLNFLAATQDIVVDGWALTMLKPVNVGYASTCNIVGQTAGYFLGYIVFLILESPEFANTFRTKPEPYGYISLQGFFFFWGIIFGVATTLVWVFKSEKDEDEIQKDHQKESMSIQETYCKLMKILKLSSVKKFVLILLTCKIGFAVTDSALGLKLKEAGLPMEHIALLAIPLLPLQIILPWLISKRTNGPKPLEVFIKAYPYRLLFGPLYSFLLWWTFDLKSSLKTLPSYYYIVLIIFYSFHQVTVYCMYVATMSFNAKISDPKIGGTYMTLFNTIMNLGGNWPATLSLWCLDRLTFASCSLDDTPCRIKSLEDQCILKGGKCQPWFDGFYVETLILTIVGLFWFLWARNRIRKIQEIPPVLWRCS